MTLFIDRSRNGVGVDLNSNGSVKAVDLSSTDATVGGGNIILVGGAGNVIMRGPADSADVTIAAVAGQAIPVTPGTVIRKTGTTATGLVSTYAK